MIDSSNLLIFQKSCLSYKKVTTNTSQVLDELPILYHSIGFLTVILQHLNIQHM